MGAKLKGTLMSPVMKVENITHLTSPHMLFLLVTVVWLSGNDVWRLKDLTLKG